jgi:hypothetical protein
MPHMSAPVIGKLGVIYLQHEKVGLTVTFRLQGCFVRLSLRLAFSVVSTALAARFSSMPQRHHSASPAF